MYCSYCGKSLKDSDKFCKDCGTKITKEISNTDSNNKQELPTSSPNKLLFVECPNCSSTFDESTKFSSKRSFIGMNMLKCEQCKKSFKYPTSKKYALDLFIGLILWIISGTVETQIGDVIAIGTMASIGIAGTLLTLQGIWGLIENSSLKSKNPQWENRLHNTLNK